MSLDKLRLSSKAQLTSKQRSNSVVQLHKLPSRFAIQVAMRSILVKAEQCVRKKTGRADRLVSPFEPFKNGFHFGNEVDKGHLKPGRRSINSAIRRSNVLVLYGSRH